MLLSPNSFSFTVILNYDYVDILYFDCLSVYFYFIYFLFGLFFCLLPIYASKNTLFVFVSFAFVLMCKSFDDVSKSPDTTSNCD
jgi:hypothetical protein